MKKAYPILLVLILLLALGLRVYHLNSNPGSLFGDEIDVGYQAYSLLQTGQDLYGNSWPVLLHSLSEYRAPLFIYSAVPFIGAFGLNEWGVRLPAAFWGLLGILGTYFLTSKLFNSKVGLFSALSLSFSPWHIQYSRAAFESTMLLSFIVFGVYFFILGQSKKLYLIPAAILFALTPYIYSTAVVLMPVLGLLLVFIYREKMLENIRIIFVAASLFIIVLTPYFLLTVSGKAGERFSMISIFTDQVLQDKVTLSQKFGGDTSSPVERFFHNKPLIWTQVFTLNYLRSFSPEFLFTQGDPNFRQSIHEMGEMFYFELILLVFGLFLIVKTKNRSRAVILGWLLAAPLPAALTADGGFHATRTFLMLVPLSVITSLALVEILDKKNIAFKYLTVLIAVLFIFNCTFYLHRYFIHYPVESWQAWQYGFKESMQFVKDNEDSYQHVLINNSYEPALERFLFWYQYSPGNFHTNFKTDKPEKNIATGFDGFRLDNKFVFGKFNGPIEALVDSKTLYVASARDDVTNPQILSDPRVKLLKTIYSPTQQPIFYIFTGTK